MLYLSMIILWDDKYGCPKKRGRVRPVWCQKCACFSKGLEWVSETPCSEPPKTWKTAWQVQKKQWLTMIHWLFIDDWLMIHWWFIDDLLIYWWLLASGRWVLENSWASLYKLVQQCSAALLRHQVFPSEEIINRTTSFDIFWYLLDVLSLGFLSKNHHEMVEF